MFNDISIEVLKKEFENKEVICRIKEQQSNYREEKGCISKVTKDDERVYFSVTIHDVYNSEVIKKYAAKIAVLKGTLRFETREGQNIFEKYKDSLGDSLYENRPTRNVTKKTTFDFFDPYNYNHYSNNDFTPSNYMNYKEDQDDEDDDYEEVTDYDKEMELISDELYDDMESDSRSSDDGWYYDDNDDEL